MYKCVTADKVLYIAGLTAHSVNVSVPVKKGHEVNCKNNKCTISCEGKIFLIGFEKNGFSQLNCIKVEEGHTAHTAQSKNDKF